MTTNNEMVETFLEAFEVAKALGEDVRFAEAVNEGGEWVLVLVELEQITDSRFVGKFGEALKAIRVHLGNPPDPYAGSI